MILQKTDNWKFRIQRTAAILTAKSGISNHAALAIFDDPCLSKFGTLRECPNVEETRNGMPAAAWKKYMNFASKNLPPSVLFRNFRFSGNLTISRIPLFLILMEEAADQTVVVLWLHKAEPDVLVIQERKRRTVANHHFLPDGVVKQIL